ncbi:MAG: hypothetical protein Q8O67_02675 [Deltaproteobacteria bacterium]|nr:hypothetical protein [Deltaproteobacteria bacterium]
MACDDDGWFGRKPRIVNAALTGADTYCIIVDGFAGVGDYDLHLLFGTQLP